MKPGTAMKKRFWKDVAVRTTSDGLHTIYLDSRPVRNPQTKVPLSIPPSKPHLATAIGLEWDLLTSAQQALRAHLIPLTSIASRAHDLAIQDAATASSSQASESTAVHQSRTIRDDIVMTLIPYLDTDTLLCWAPPTPKEADPTTTVVPSLRDLQARVAEPIISYLTTSVWPGVQLNPSLDEGSIFPTEQPRQTKDIIRGWMTGLNAWELVGLERAVLAGKSLCVGARLLCEWGESFADVRKALGSGSHQGVQRFGIEDAAQACSIEVMWQTGRWGEVEDTHDVDKEDLRSQFGSAVLVASGTTQA
ncbi:ATP synthase mitochondrial F1 complex assembly factor 2 [Xanthoria calcicola]